MNRKTFVVIIIALFLVAWGVMRRPLQQPQAATAKGRVIAAQMQSITSADQILWNLALNDAVVGAFMADKELDLLRVIPLKQGEAAAFAGCATGECSLLRFYNYTDGGTIETVFNSATKQFVKTWQDLGNRPNPSFYLTKKVVDIAAVDQRVVDVLGDIRQAETAMIPMSTWLNDNECRTDWCVDLTFHDPSESGKIFHIVVNMHEQAVSRTFFTRGRDDRFYQEADGLDEDLPAFTDGCHEEFGWNVCWEMTADDGVNFFNARYEDQLIFTTAKIGQVEAYYPSWPGGYRDEIGFASTVPPKFDTRLIEMEDAFQIRQLFTEPFDWPNCICCYRYVQVMTFGADGSFEPDFVSEGPGCDELSEYRPFWRFNLAMNGEANESLYYWDETQWTEAQSEQDLPLYETGIDGERLITLAGDITYRWIPERSDPLGLDEGRLFIVESEGDVPIVPGPADTYDPPRALVTGEDLTDADSDLVVWYVPILKTKKGGPWWCQPDPEPLVSPCSVGMRVVRSSKRIEQPTEAELAQLEANRPTPVPPQITPTPSIDENGNEIAAVATLRPTPRAISGASADEIMLNSGCGACHVIGELGEEGKVGPSLSNIGNVARERVPGQSAETYLRNSILYPNIYLVEECPNAPCQPNVMPGTYYLQLTEGQVAMLVDYMLTLQDEEPQEIGSLPDGTDSTQSNNVQTNTAQGGLDNATIVLISLVAVAVGFLLLSVYLLIGRRGKRDDSSESA